jgi:chromosome segregation ATPase
MFHYDSNHMHVFTAKEMALNDLISELERSEILVKRIEYMKVSLETAKASMTAITEERRVLQDNHQRVKAQLQEEIQQIQSSSKSKEEELKTLLTAVDVAKKKEEELTKRIDQSKERLKCLEEENEDRRTRIDVTKDDLKVVMEKRSALSLELISLKSQIDTSIADNERDYELTCEALKDLHELHALDAQLHYRLETVSWIMFLCCICELSVSVESGV